MIWRYHAAQNIISYFKELRFYHKGKCKCKCIWQTKEHLTMCWGQGWERGRCEKASREETAKSTLKGIKVK